MIQGSRGKVIINKKSFGVTLHHHVDTNTDYGHCDFVTNTRTDGGVESVSVVCVEECFVFLLFTIYRYFVPDTTRCLRLSQMSI